MIEMNGMNEPFTRTFASIVNQMVSL